MNSEINSKLFSFLRCFFDPKEAQTWTQNGAKMGPKFELGGYLGTSWRHLGTTWGHLGTILGPLGPLGAMLGPSWDLFGAFLGPPRDRLGAILGLHRQQHPGPGGMREAIESAAPWVAAL